MRGGRLLFGIALGKGIIKYNANDERLSVNCLSYDQLLNITGNGVMGYVVIDKIDALLFTNLDQMETGDYFQVNVLGKVLNYQVDQVLVIEPEETDPLEIEEGKDYVTLVTCTPYAVNTHRLLIRGVRVDNGTE